MYYMLNQKKINTKIDITFELDSEIQCCYHELKGSVTITKSIY